MCAVTEHKSAAPSENHKCSFELLKSPFAFDGALEEGGGGGRGRWWWWRLGAFSTLGGLIFYHHARDTNYPGDANEAGSSGECLVSC